MLNLGFCRVFAAVTVMAGTAAGGDLLDSTPLTPVGRVDGLRVWTWGGGDYGLVSVDEDPFAVDGGPGWVVECPFDALSDVRTCTVRYASGVGGQRGWLTIDYGTGNRPLRVCVQPHDSGRGDAVIRVDKRAPITADGACASAARVLSDLLSGTQVTMRRRAGGVQIDEVVQLHGLSLALDLVAAIRSEEWGR